MAGDRDSWDLRALPASSRRHGRQERAERHVGYLLRRRYYLPRRVPQPDVLPGAAGERRLRRTIHRFQLAPRRSHLQRDLLADVLYPVHDDGAHPSRRRDGHRALKESMPTHLTVAALVFLLAIVVAMLRLMNPVARAFDAYAKNLALRLQLDTDQFLFRVARAQPLRELTPSERETILDKVAEEAYLVAEQSAKNNARNGVIVEPAWKLATAVHYAQEKLTALSIEITSRELALRIEVQVASHHVELPLSKPE